MNRPEFKRSTLVVVTFVINETNLEYAEDDDGETRFERDSKNRVLDFLQSQGDQIEWVSLGSSVLPSATAGRCAKCGVWTSDRWAEIDESPQHYGMLSIGTVHDGALLCDLCLPEEHPLHF